MAGRNRGRDDTRERRAWPPRWLRWVPAVLIGLMLVLDATLPPPYEFSSLLTCAVLFAALVNSVRTTIALSTAALAALAVNREVDGTLGQADVVSGMALLGVISVMSCLIAVARARATRELADLRLVSETVQRALLRPLPRRLGPLRMSGFYRAADDVALIGGDLYCARSGPGGVRVLVGDVRGKGIGTAETVATIVAAFGEAASVAPELADVAQHVERAMARDRDATRVAAAPSLPPPPAKVPGDLSEDPRTDLPVAVAGLYADEEPSDRAAELFTTAVMLEFPTGEAAVRLLDCGHVPVLRIGADGVEELRTEPGLPLGLGDLAPFEPSVERFPLEAGEVLVACSDGVTEARDADGVFYPLRERLAGEFGGRSDLPAPEDVVGFVSRDLEAWAESLNDDIVLLALSRGTSPA